MIARDLGLSDADIHGVCLDFDLGAAFAGEAFERREGEEKLESYTPPKKPMRPVRRYRTLAAVLGLDQAADPVLTAEARAAVAADVERLRYQPADDLRAFFLGDDAADDAAEPEA